MSLCKNDDLLCLGQDGSLKVLNVRKKEVVLESDIVELMKHTYESLVRNK